MWCYLIIVFDNLRHYYVANHIVLPSVKICKISEWECWEIVLLNVKLYKSSEWEDVSQSLALWRFASFSNSPKMLHKRRRWHWQEWWTHEVKQWSRERKCAYSTRKTIKEEAGILLNRSFLVLWVLLETLTYVQVRNA